MAEKNIAGKSSGSWQTYRKDAWWVSPVAVFAGLSFFLSYMTWAALQGNHYSFGTYISPLYSPEIFGDSPRSWFGPKPDWWPTFMPWSPALMILWAPALFRFTCYYYRGAYYKAFWADPSNCAVSEPRNIYLGENSYPLILQNVHRYFMYIALIFIIILTWDVWLALWFENPVTGEKTFRLGVGTLVMAGNAGLLGSYTLGCHSLRHMVGGFMDRMSGKPVALASFKCVSCLNRSHMLFAWTSLFWVSFTDFYVRMCSMGVFTDFRIF